MNKPLTKDAFWIKSSTNYTVNPPIEEAVRLYTEERVREAVKGLSEDLENYWDKLDPYNHDDCMKIHAVDSFSEMIEKWFPVFKEEEEKE